MSRTLSVRWLVACIAAGLLAVAMAVPAGADPPQDARPGTGSSPATAIAICCRWGPGITDGITYAIVGAPDDATADAIADGVEEWDDAIADPGVHFDLVTSGAEVTIRFKRGGGTVAGSTSRSSSAGLITGASMSISGKAFGSTNSGTELTTVTAHEWGHVLGLNHANGTGLLMSPYLDPNVTVIKACDLGAGEAALAVSPPSSYTC